MTVLAVSNQKGGVGKTTTAINVAAYAALAGKRVLLVDFDPQGNASSVLVPAEQHPPGTILDDQAPLPSTAAGVDVIPGGAGLRDREHHLVQASGGRQFMRKRLDGLKAVYDLVVIDCPPSLSLLPVNALLAADRLLIPIQCEYFAMEGLSQLLAALQDLREQGNGSLDLAGILLTMYDDRLALARQVAAELRRHFPTHVLKTAIPRDIALAAAPSHGKSIIDYDPLSAGGIAYLEATRELLHVLR
ncbi:MAG: ParA family protein [Planctomycetes bacterium]|nr:ParA family protein [Planctomycetota bacterium]